MYVYTLQIISQITNDGGDAARVMLVITDGSFTGGFNKRVRIVDQPLHKWTGSLEVNKSYVWYPLDWSTKRIGSSEICHWNFTLFNGTGLYCHIHQYNDIVILYFSGPSLLLQLLLVVDSEDDLFLGNNYQYLQEIIDRVRDRNPLLVYSIPACLHNTWVYEPVCAHASSCGKMKRKVCSIVNTSGFVVLCLWPV